MPVGGTWATLYVCVNAVEGMRYPLIGVTTFLNTHHRLSKAGERSHYGVGMFPQVCIRKTGCGGEQGTDGWNSHSDTVVRNSDVHQEYRQVYLCVCVCV